MADLDNTGKAAARTLVNARRLVRDGQLDEARDLVRTVLEDEPRNGAGLRLMAGIEQRRGDWVGAIAALAAILDANPRDPSVLHDLARVLVKSGDVESALAHMELALRLDPAKASLHLDFARLCEARKRVALAKAHYRIALDLDRENAVAVAGLRRVEAAGVPPQEDVPPQWLEEVSGVGLVASGVPAEAAQAEAKLRALALQHPARPEAYARLGLLYMQNMRAALAVVELSRAVAFKPTDAELHNNLSVALNTAGLPMAALREAKITARLLPKDAGVFNNIGLILRGMGDDARAIAALRKAVSMAPDPGPYRLNLALTCHRHGDLKGAIEQFRFLANEDRKDPIPLIHLAELYLEAGYVTQSIQSVDQALALNHKLPMAHRIKASGQLLLGNYREGWRELEWRLVDQTYAPAFTRRFPEDLRWHGESLRGKRILVWLEPDNSESFIFLRYLDDLRVLAERVILEVPPSMRELAEDSDLADAYVAPGEVHGRDWDVHSPVMSLARFFNTEGHTIPANIPYLRVSQRKAHEWRNTLKVRGRKVALVWSANPSRRHDPYGSCHESDLHPLQAVSGVNWYGLQHGRPNPDLPGFENLADLPHSFADLAAILKQFDLIISTDTQVCHLAAALGCRVWVVVPRVSHWRWPMGGTASPWYPQVRVFRAQRAQKWKDQFRDVAIALAQDE
ncbi:MAG: tetratricopeptide repeat protein [Gammaproteobacteria bacterium]